MTQRVGSCQDCLQPFAVGPRGYIPFRCPACRKTVRQQRDRAYQQANREAHNEANRRYRARHKNPPRLVSLTCVDCGAKYEKLHTGGRLSSRCPACRTSFRLNRVREQTAERRRTNPEYFTEWRKRNSDVATARALQWAKDNPDRHSARSARYRSRRFSSTVEVFTRQEIGDRDGWTCAVCREPIDQELTHPDPWAGELDHVIPVTHPQYPGHTRDNAAVVHSRCNKHKGGYKGTEQG